MSRAFSRDFAGMQRASAPDGYTASGRFDRPLGRVRFQHNRLRTRVRRDENQATLAEGPDAIPRHAAVPTQKRLSDLRGNDLVTSADGEGSGPVRLYANQTNLKLRVAGLLWRQLDRPHQM